MDQEKRIAMETRMAYQEKLLHELNTVVFEQQKEIDRLKEQVRLLSQRILALAETAHPAVPTDKPPHY